MSKPRSDFDGGLPVRILWMLWIFVRRPANLAVITAAFGGAFGVWKWVHAPPNNTTSEPPKIIVTNQGGGIAVNRIDVGPGGIVALSQGPPAPPAQQKPAGSPAPESPAVPPPTRDFSLLAEDVVRRRIDDALKAESGDVAVDIIAGLGSSRMKEEECERVFNAMLKKKEFENARKLVEKCWEGLKAKEMLSQVEHEDK